MTGEPVMYCPGKPGATGRGADRPRCGVAELGPMPSVALIGTAEQNVRTGERALLLDLRESPSPD